MLFWALDRFSREGIRKTIAYLEHLDACGVAFKSYTEPFLDTDNELITHIVLGVTSYYVVAHSSADRCRRDFDGGSGSLILDTTVAGAAHHDANRYEVQPFRIGDIAPDKGYVHVLDDTTLDVVLATLDTITISSGT